MSPGASSDINKLVILKMADDIRDLKGRVANIELFIIISTIAFILVVIVLGAKVEACPYDPFEISINEECSQPWFDCVPEEELRKAIEASKTK